MAVNGYFNNFPQQARFNNEHMLMEDVIVESIQIMGHNVYYIPRESFDEGDMIFGEYSKSKFDKAYLIEAYLANVEGFEGQGDFFSKFGLEIRDTSNFILSRRSFKKIIPSTLRTRPREGDLVYIPVLHKMFEVKFIEQEAMFHSLGKVLPYVYEMRCEAFRFSNDEIDTGVDEVDNVGADNSYTVRLNLNQGNGQNLLDEDVIFQSPDGTFANNTAHAIVKEWYKANGTLFVYNVAGDFSANANVFANSTGAIYKVLNKDNRTDYSEYNINDNEEFKLDADVILDLSEKNPFGVP